MWDQTDRAWFIGRTLTSLGTGLFLIPAPRTDDLRDVRKLAKPDISYPECVRTGSDGFAIAIKWVPNDVETFPSLLTTKCDDDECEDTCAKPGCLCHPQKRICVEKIVESL